MTGRNENKILVPSHITVTNSSDFPTTAGAFQTDLAGSFDAFVTKFNAAGSTVLYSTYLGGSGGDGASGVAVDDAGDAYIIGFTTSSDFPTTSGAFQTSFAGSEDAFASKLNAAGSALVYSTYLGEAEGSAIAVDALGSAYVTGLTGSSDFPTTRGAFQTTFGGYYDAFVSKLNAAGSALLYSTYLGGSGPDSGQGITLDASGNAYITGSAGSSNFPTTAGAFQTTYRGGPAYAPFEAFVIKFSFAAAPVLTLKPPALTFPVLRTVGTTSLPQTVKLTNVGGAELDVTRITLTGLTAATSPSPITVLPVWPRAEAALLLLPSHPRPRGCAPPRSRSRTTPPAARTPFP
jgi:hypothetical protein